MHENRQKAALRIAGIFEGGFQETPGQCVDRRARYWWKLDDRGQEELRGIFVKLHAGVWANVPETRGNAVFRNERDIRVIIRGTP